MTFKDGFEKVAYFLYGRDFLRLHNGLETARLHVENTAKDLGLSAEGVAQHLGFSEDIGRLAENEVVSFVKPVENDLQLIAAKLEEVPTEIEKVIKKKKVKPTE